VYVHLYIYGECVYVCICVCAYKEKKKEEGVLATVYIFSQVTASYLNQFSPSHTHTHTHTHTGTPASKAKHGASPRRRKCLRWPSLGTGSWWAPRIEPC
jgi:hypothetical protein